MAPPDVEKGLPTNESEHQAVVTTQHYEVARQSDTSSGSIRYAKEAPGGNDGISTARLELTPTDHPNPWSKFREFMKEPFGEFLGTMIMIIFGDGVVAQVILSNSTKGTYQSISWAWGIGVAMGVWVAAGISGAHLNPAVTLSLVIHRKFPIRKLPKYWIGQFLGAYAGAALVYGNYRSAIDAYEGHGIRSVNGTNATCFIYNTYPAAFMTTTGAFFSELVGTVILMIGIFAIGDQNNSPPPKGMAPVALLFLVTGIGMSWGWETGYAINPARDLGPRMLAFTVGYGKEVFTTPSFSVKNYAWIPVVAPLLGGPLGGLLYDAFLYEGDAIVNKEWSWNMNNLRKMSMFEN